MANLVNGDTFAFEPYEAYAPVNISSRLTNQYAGISCTGWQCGHVVYISAQINRSISSNTQSAIIKGCPTPAGNAASDVECPIWSSGSGRAWAGQVTANGNFMVTTAFEFTGDERTAVCYLTNDLSAYNS